MKRSKGVTTYAIISIVYGILIFLVQSFGWLGLALSQIPVSGMDVITSVIAFLLGCGFLISGIGLLDLRMWARKIMLLSALIAIPNGYIGGILGALRSAPVQPGVQAPPATAIIIAAVIFITPFALFFASILYFLTRPAVKAQFDARAAQ